MSIQRSRVRALLLPFAFASAAARGQGAAPPPAASRPAQLVGHWRKTRIIAGQPIDEHLILAADGRMSNWTVTATSRGAPHSGLWRVEGKRLMLQLQGEPEADAPYTLHEGQLVLPNIPNRRQFWERLQRL